MDDQKTIVKQIATIAEVFCSEYCKYPDTWDEEKEECELAESDICTNCPINKLI